MTLQKERRATDLYHKLHRKREKERKGIAQAPLQPWDYFRESYFGGKRPVGTANFIILQDRVPASSTCSVGQEEEDAVS